MTKPPNPFFEEVQKTDEEIAQFDKAQQKAYERSLRNYWDWNAIMETAIEEAYEKAYEKAYEEGRKEIQIATTLKLKEAGSTREFILQVTGIDINDLDPTP